MKVHAHLIEQVIIAVVEIFRTARPADKVIEKFMKEHRRWGSRDRRFFAESVYEIVRHWRRLWVAAGLPPQQFLERDALTPAEVWRVWARFQWERTGEIPPLPAVASLRFSETPTLSRAEQESIPDWLDRLGESEVADGWPGLLTALNRPASVYLRANALKATRVTVRERLSAEGIVTELVGESGPTLVLPERKNVFTTAAFRDGWFEVQDAASQRVAPLLDPQPGERIIDACAGAGGKTLHLAALMKNRGRLLALDIHEWKLGELRERARRAGVDIIEARVIESTKTIKRLTASADGVLLDVPCSGLGVLRRNPDSKWRLTPEEMDRLRDLQAEILVSYSRMAKPGGRMVYATCSVLPSENEVQVQKFLASEAGRGWSLAREIHLRPDREGFDGFYAALLRRDLEPESTPSA